MRFHVRTGKELLKKNIPLKVKDENIQEFYIPHMNEFAYKNENKSFEVLKLSDNKKNWLKIKGSPYVWHRSWLRPTKSQLEFDF